MTDIPQALVEKGAAAERECMKSWGDDLGQSEARMRARTVLAAVWPDLPAARPVVDREALAKALETHTRCYGISGVALADAILASGVAVALRVGGRAQELSEVVCGVRMTPEQAEALRANLHQDAADVRRAVAEEIAAAIERRRLRRRHRWMRSHRWSGRDEACWSQGMWDAERIAREAGSA